MTTQSPGHLYGPAAPHIGFWHGDIFVGQVRGTPDDVEGAKGRLARHIRILENAEDSARMLYHLEHYTEAKVICGSAVSPIRAPSTSSTLLRRLKEAGYIIDRLDDEGLQYVLMLVHDPVRDVIIGLLKQRGPQFLVGKLTFPGGKTEAGETPEQACSRETKEEAGITVPVNAWKFVARSSVVMVMAAVSDQVLHAKQCDDEPVYVMSVPRQLDYAARNPHAYVPDFIVLLEAGLATLG